MRPSSQRFVMVLYALTSVLTASLLFVVQPMVARMVLPAFGGSPQVWTTAMLFFQASLLVGYAYTHFATVHIRAHRQPFVHLGLLALPLLSLPIALGVTPGGRGGVAPSLELLAALTLGVAAPFILVATSGPLLQRWFSWTAHPHRDDPYVLYAAGNVGSIGGLLAYPFLLEPLLSVQAQARLWATGYAVALVMIGACAVPAIRMRRRDAAGGAPVHRRPQPSPPIGRRRAARWIFLAFVPSSTMLAVTTYLSTDIAAVPMLWIVPLAVYLATFVVAFSGWGPRATRVATWLAVPVAVASIAVGPGTGGLTLAVVIQTLLVIVAGLVCHGRLSAQRPPTAQLTRFFVLLAVGGAMGGLVNGILAPLVFPLVVEHGLIVAVLAWIVARELPVPVPGTAHWRSVTRMAATVSIALLPVVAFAIGTGLLPAPGGTVGRLALLAAALAALTTRIGRSGAIAVSLTLLASAPAVYRLVEAREVDRTFFGVHRVIDTSQDRVLIHGTTVHGNQNLTDDTTRRQPSAYYAADGPFGDIADVARTRGDIGVLGLGAGGIAAYGVSGQRIVFHEIDPAMERIAREHFTFLDDSDAEVAVVLGDGRLTVEDIDGEYGMLIADAFSSDSVPVHLLTVEAVETYLRTLTHDGVVVLHLSNRYLELVPVAVGAADELGLRALMARTPPDAERALPTTWVVMGPDDGRLDEFRDRGWLAPDVGGTPWTDQRSDLWSVVRR